MLTISNNKNDEIGTETWTDFFCVIVRKSGKFGFFTKNGKLIDPIYEAYAIDPCGGEIHVKTNDGYGVLSSPSRLGIGGKRHSFGAGEYGVCP